MCKLPRNKLEKIAPDQFRVNICPKRLKLYKEMPHKISQLLRETTWPISSCGQTKVYTAYHLPVTSEQRITISACQAKKIYNCYQCKHVFNVMMPSFNNKSLAASVNRDQLLIISSSAVSFEQLPATDNQNAKSQWWSISVDRTKLCTAYEK